MYFGAPLKQAVETGAVPMARLDGMVTNILTGMIENGVLDAPMPAAAQPIDYDAHAEVAQRDAEAGIVLLRNEGDVLPLATTAKRIVLIGGHADVGVLSGGGSSQKSEEHTSELQSLMRISYAVFCLKKKKETTNRR